MNIKLLTIVAILLLLISKIGMAQSTLMDLNVQPLLPDSTTPMGFIAVAIELKSGDPSAIDILTILAGTQPNSGDILIDTVSIQQISNLYYADYHGDQILIEDHHVRWYMLMTEQQWDAYQYITVFGLIPPAGQTNVLQWEK